MKDWRQAEDTLLELLDSDPTDPDYWQLLANIRVRRKDFASAAAAFEVAYSLETPTLADLEQLANLYSYLHLPSKKAKCLHRAYGKNLPPERCDILASDYLEAGRMDKAILYIDQAIRKEPSAARFFEKGKIYYRCGQWLQAIEALRHAVELQPDFGSAHLLLGSCALADGNFSLAVDAFNHACEEQESRKQALAALSVLQDFTTLKDQAR